MFGITPQLAAILLLGVLIGAIIANKTFRTKFFKSLRSFLAQISQGAREYNKQQRGGRDTMRRGQRQDEDKVEHRYVRTHRLVKCEKCGGTGRIAKKVPKIVDERLFGKKTEECPDCEGAGKVYD